MAKKILVVEDDPDIRYTLELILRHAGYDVKSLATPAPILGGQIEPPDLFIVDISLPLIDGLTLCQVLRTNERTKDIPIVLMSASKSSKRLATECGANDFLEKPFHLNELLQSVEKYLSIPTPSDL